MGKILADPNANARRPDVPIPQLGTPIGAATRAYHSGMSNDDHHELPPALERYLALCKRIYERMERENSWPWLDSTEPVDLLESDRNPDDV